MEEGKGGRGSDRFLSTEKRKERGTENWFDECFTCNILFSLATSLSPHLPFPPPRRRQQPPLSPYFALPSCQSPIC